MSEKSIVIFTNFWDANSVIDFCFLLLHDIKKQKLYRINLFKDDTNTPKNFSVHSIALSHPDLSKQLNMSNMNRIDCLCPTYDMLKRYKADHNWEMYQKDFIELIKKRKAAIKDWANSLKPNWVYFLCCWENTTNGSHCHREILHKAFTESNVMSKKMVSVYRHGDRNYNKDSRQIVLDSDLDDFRGDIQQLEGGAFNSTFITASYNYVNMDGVPVVPMVSFNPDGTMTVTDQDPVPPISVVRGEVRIRASDSPLNNLPDEPPF